LCYDTYNIFLLFFNTRFVHGCFAMLITVDPFEDVLSTIISWLKKILKICFWPEFIVILCAL
jgi:hypothetical protein